MKLFSWIQIIVQLRLNCGVCLWILQKNLRTPYLLNISKRPCLDFFIHLNVFTTHWVNRDQFFFYFWTCFITAFKRDECHKLCIWKTTLRNKWLRCYCMGTTWWEHAFLWDIVWNCVVNLFTYTYWFPVLYCHVILHWKVTEATTRGVP